MPDARAVPAEAAEATERLAAWVIGALSAVVVGGVAVVIYAPRGGLTGGPSWLPTINAALNGATLTLDPSSTPGNAVLHFTSSTPLAPGLVRLGGLAAQVPDTAGYRAKGLLHLTNILVNGGSIAAVNEFDPLFDDIYAFCEAQEIEIDTLIHEDGAAQMEINLLHGEALDLADQAFLFKRTAREAAMRHKMYATFMAKPMAREPGSAMHIHQSIIDKKTKQNIFSNPDGTPSQLFFSHIAGLQKYLPAAMSLLCPNVNSYRRITRYLSAPINVQWGYDNRTAGLRVPMSPPEARRVENRVGGADANSYLAIAASLACGYLGMIEGLKPTDPITGSAHDLPFALPRTLDEALKLLRTCKPLVELFGDRFVRAYTAVKENEYETFSQVISSWEREHLLLNV